MSLLGRECFVRLWFSYGLWSFRSSISNENRQGDRRGGEKIKLNFHSCVYGSSRSSNVFKPVYVFKAQRLYISNKVVMSTLKFVSTIEKYRSQRMSRHDDGPPTAIFQRGQRACRTLFKKSNFQYQ
eukprot:scaffold24561_cov64-Attheya_sp.AAC.8